ncbi:MAG: RluA family pseudouridine synthase [Nitrospirae bacterium]|nr:RluA family pseudouridine synthase [Nitrospirota bacterium]
MEIMRLPVGDESVHERIDAFISLQSGLSRSRIQKFIKDGLVSVNSKIEKSGYRLRKGDIIELTVPDEPVTTLIPEDILLDIVMQDSDIVVVNKPPGMVMYPAAGHTSGTLLNALIAKCGRLASTGAPLRPGVVHRLDKETSGLIIFAKNDKAYLDLIKQFQEKEIEKYYMALIYGIPKKEQGEINDSIGRSVSDRKKMSTKTRRGKEAITRYEVIKRFTGASLIKARIITGRTHQIRVHFASVGHPVLGDKTYGKKTAIRCGHRVITFPRQMLHAFSLKFKHPSTRKFIELTAPMPEDMEKGIEALNEFGIN